MSRRVRAEAGRSGPRRPGRVAVGTLVLALAMLAAGASIALVALRGPAPPKGMADRVRAVASTLRCPVCQNLSVADSPSRLAQEMRRTIARDLQSGKTPERIRQEFAGAYGAWILETPPKRGIDLAVWIAPVLLVLGGLAAAGAAVWRWTGHGLRARDTPAPAGSGPSLSPADRSLLERALANAEEVPE
ncbi:MAG: cytochrome c-type biogenesis protein [Actinomycetota bacterium]